MLIPHLRHHRKRTDGTCGRYPIHDDAQNWRICARVALSVLDCGEANIRRSAADPQRSVPRNWSLSVIGHYGALLVAASGILVAAHARRRAAGPTGGMRSHTYQV